MRWTTTMTVLAAVLAGCGDKDSGEGDDTDRGVDGDDTDISEADDTGDVEEVSPSSFTAGQYRFETFALVSAATEGMDLDGDGDVDNKLPSVLTLAATLTGEPLSVDALNAEIAADIAKGTLIMLAEAEQTGLDLRLDVLLGAAVKGGGVTVDAASYGSDGSTPNSRLMGRFETEVDFAASAMRIELPFPLLTSAPPVLVPLELVQAGGTLDAGGNTVLVGGAVPVDDFMAQVVEPLIPTGEDYDPELYLDMEREELIAFIYNFVSGETVADIELSDGRKAVSAAVTYTASPATF